MKVFISWSGEHSKRIATVFHEWLPSVLQIVHPYMSAENIEKGERWSIDLAGQLEQTDYGIICVTPGNVTAPWILFESGALSKSIQKSKVSPIMFGLSPSDFMGSPLLQFQLTGFVKDDIRKLLNSINNSAPETEKIGQSAVDKAFNRAWSELEDAVRAIDLPEEVAAAVVSARSVPSGLGSATEDAIQEILSNTRSQIKLLNSPSDLIPPAYLAHIARELSSSLEPAVEKDHQVWRDIENNLLELADFLAKIEINNNHELPPSLRNNIEKISSATRYIQGRLYRRR